MNTNVEIHRYISKPVSELVLKLSIKNDSGIIEGKKPEHYLHPF
jgi:hypothetical protein